MLKRTDDNRCVTSCPPSRTVIPGVSPATRNWLPPSQPPVVTRTSPPLHRPGPRSTSRQFETFGVVGDGDGGFRTAPKVSVEGPRCHDLAVADGGGYRSSLGRGARSSQCRCDDIIETNGPGCRTRPRGSAMIATSCTPSPETLPPPCCSGASKANHPSSAALLRRPEGRSRPSASCRTCRGGRWPHDSLGGLPEKLRSRVVQVPRSRSGAPRGTLRRPSGAPMDPHHRRVPALRIRAIAGAGVSAPRRTDGIQPGSPACCVVGSSRWTYRLAWGSVSTVNLGIRPTCGHRT